MNTPPMLQDGPRRRLALLAGALLLAGCQTTPPAPTREDKITTLKRLGFVSDASDNGWDLNLGVKLLFDSNADEVSAEGRAAIAEVGRALKAVGIDRLTVEGHTDNVGGKAYNDQLSLRRAEAVSRELTNAGLDGRAIERRGRGADKPVASNATPEGRAQNRRVVVTVSVE